MLKDNIKTIGFTTNSYTTIAQSRRLRNIFETVKYKPEPYHSRTYSNDELQTALLFSADMCYGIDGSGSKYIEKPMLIDWRLYSARDYYLPCWSLGRLLEIADVCSKTRSFNLVKSLSRISRTNIMEDVLNFIENSVSTDDFDAYMLIFK